MLREAFLATFGGVGSRVGILPGGGGLKEAEMRRLLVVVSILAAAVLYAFPAAASAAGTNAHAAITITSNAGFTS